MKFMGSKNRIAEQILPIILKDRTSNQWYIEPFVGGGNMIDKVKGERIGYDIDFNVINGLISIRDNIEDLPKNNKEFTENDYKNLRNNDYVFKGYAGFAFSYGGKWLGGWSRDGENKRDYVKEAYNNALNQTKNIQDVIFITESFKKIYIPSKSIIYCDPPYGGATKYNSSFNHFDFWDWCRGKAKEGHKVFVSEYHAPDDFIILWQKQIVSSLIKDTGAKKGIEKLFTIY